MKKVATTKMTSKGQIVIPEEIREQLGLKVGCQFIVIGAKDIVILKTLSPPSMDDFKDLISEARKQAQKAGLKKSDIAKAIIKVRKDK